MSLINLLSRFLRCTSPWCIAYQKNTIYVLKRKWEPPLSKCGVISKKLKAKHYVYKLIEDTSVRKQRNLNVTLSQFVENIGNAGDTISLKSRTAYNNIILPGYGDYSKPETHIFSTKDPTSRSPYVQRSINMLNRITLAVVMNKDISWIIKPWHIRVSLRKVGFYCEDACITLSNPKIEGPDLEKENTDFFATITINNKETTNLKCRIHHWSTNPRDRLPYLFEHWKDSNVE